MPIFEYQCSKCKKVVEVIAKNTDEKSHCPNCNELLVERVLSVCNSTTSNKSDDCTSGGCTAGSCCSNGLCNLK